MSIHKLTAGDGYSYLTRQVAAFDATERGHAGLSDYYSQRGESPGQWLGSALGDVGLQDGQEVTAAQMAALFGEGKHPNADTITEQVMDKRAGGSGRLQDVQDAIRLGGPFAVIDSAPAFRVAVAKACAQVNAGLGMPHDRPLPAAEQARVRTDVGRDMFTREYGRPPKDPRELSSFIARHSRAATTAVAGFDLSFTPVKSVSALWAIAPQAVADQIAAAHHAAVQDALSWLERDAVLTRGGRNGVQQLDTTGMIAAAFGHRDSRAGDPDLHTHVAVSSKVRVRTPDGTPGRWLSLDGRVLFKATVSASERYNTRVEAELHRRLGLSFTPRSDAAAALASGRRTIREVTGLPEQLLTHWSSRRARIDIRLGQLAVAFQFEHGRPPTPVEAIKLAQQATLDTRDAKHAPRSEAQQRRQWRTEAAQVLGGDRAVDTLVRTVVDAPQARVVPVAPDLIERVAEATKRVVESHRATWQVWHVRSEAERQIRAQAPAGADVDALVEDVIAAVLHPDTSIPLGGDDPVPVPALLRRRDGASVYEVAGSRLYTSATVLADEAFLLETAGRRGGRAVTDVDVEVALVEFVANGVTLNTAQAHLVRAMATSGARVQLAIAPAGSGKTTAMAALTTAWTGAGGTVIGLAPSAVAAGILAQESGTTAETLAKLTFAITAGLLPDWAQKVDEATLFIVDEAGMASTGDLAAVTRFALERGASVRLVGDDRQLASIAAGGVLRDIQASVGAVTLSELIRFRDPAEGAASLAIRCGDTAGIGFYIDRGRVHVGDLATVTDHAYTAWSTDRAAGLDSIMLAPTRDLATELNIRARTDRLTRLITGDDQTAPRTRRPSREVGLVDGSSASTGDLVITRRNNRRLKSTATDFVKNGDRWTVTQARGDGSLDVVHTRTGRHLTLPAEYVREHVQLGYATTVHGGQGVTCDSSHTVATGAESRQQLYVAVTRGRDANHVYLAAAGDGEEHCVITPAATHPLTAVNVLEQILGRDQAQVSAATTAARLSEPAADTTAAAARYHDSLHTAAVHVLGDGWTERLDATLEQTCPGLTHSAAYPTLRSHLALLAVDGADPVAAFTAAWAAREIDTAADVAAVLDWRLDPTHARSRAPGPLPWLAAIPAALRTDPYWGEYLAGRQQHVHDAVNALRGQTGDLTAVSAPPWAHQLLAPQHRLLLADVAVFRAAHAVHPDETRPTGPRRQAAADRREQRTLDERVAAAMDTGHRAGWTPLAVQVGLTPRTDPHWPALADNLAALSRAGADAPAMLRKAAAEGPLPDEYQAAALWWRIARHVAPAVLTPDRAGAPGDPLRPDWLPALSSCLGQPATDTLSADPRWPAVITAITRASEHGIPLPDLVQVPVGHDGQPVPDHALADALIYRALSMTDPVPFDPSDPYDWPGAAYPLDPYDEDLIPPKDLHLVSIDLDPNPPLNLAVPDIEAPEYGQRPPAADDPAPLPVETVSVDEVALSEPQLDHQLFQAARNRQWLPPWEPTPAQQERALARAAEAEFSPVTPERIAALNEQAATFYQGTYYGSWAQTYLADRLGGTDLAGDPRTRPGYAPAGWTTLTAHLRHRGASDDELLAAGLAKQACTGRLIDTFRDRLVLPIQHHEHVVGFVGRRNPDTDHHEKTGDEAGNKAGPKYLNTSETVLFAKADQLYGMDPHADRLAQGGAPVLVEGPIDAIAVSLACPDHVGVAPLGTALTDTQADILTREHPAKLVVATDPDVAGQVAADRDYWILAARGADPQHAALPRGLDPADVLRTAGPAALRRHLEQAGPLANALVDERLAHLPVAAGLAEALAVVAAGDAERWRSRTTDIARRLHVPVEVALTQLIPAVAAWDRDRAGESASRIHDNATRDRITGQSALSPAARWAPLARQINPALVRAHDWGSLAATIDRADRAGLDVQTLLPSMVATRPLAAEYPAADLRYRLEADLDPDDTPLPGPGAQVAASRGRRPQPPIQPPNLGRSPRDNTPSR
jgi:DNA primase catalytic core